MKLSSRKKLLEDADETLKKIRQRIINEQPWEPEDYKNQRDFIKTFSPRSKIESLESIFKKRLINIQNRYLNSNDEISKQKEIEELTTLLQKIKQHLTDNWKEIPENPEQQSTIQKIIVNTPKLPKNYDYTKSVAKTLIKDPDTGMYWTRVGAPTLPPNWEEDYWQNRSDQLGIGRETSNILFDKSKPLIYRIIKALFTSDSNITYD